MPQFDVYENFNEHTKAEFPFLLDVQADLLNSLSTRVVVPLVISSMMDKPISHLNPGFVINKKTVFMSTSEMAGISVRNFGKKVGSLKDQRNTIISALDFLFTGF
ncbi:MAG: CcdB family protein [Candidatus Ozemobacteraceae bacterium]